jgi:hypothetical protein
VPVEGYSPPSSSSSSVTGQTSGTGKGGWSSMLSGMPASASS